MKLYLANNNMKQKISYIYFIGLILLCSFSNIVLYAGIDNKALPNKPNPPRLVNDFAGILSSGESQRLENKLVAFSDSSSNQIAVVTVANMGDYAAIEDFSYDLGKKWGVGKADKDNGILIVISMAERKSRIEIGSGLEGAVPDIIASELIRNVLRPAFKQQKYFDGLDGTIDNLIAASKNEYHADPKANTNDDGGGVVVLIMIFLFIVLLIWIKTRNAQNNKYYMSRRGARGWNDPWIGGGGFIGGGGGGFFDGGGNSGGGFGGFGGGGFSGGGASGDW
jgi:uncharacterized protein